MTQDVSKTASQLVILTAPLGQTISAGQCFALNEITSTSGLASTTYVVPSGEHLVITGMEVVNYYANGGMSLYMPVPGGLLGIENLYFPTAGTQQFLFLSGLSYAFRHQRERGEHFRRRAIRHDDRSSRIL